jgi:hypothetical protein
MSGDTPIAPRMENGIAYCSHGDCPHYCPDPRGMTVGAIVCDELGRWPSRVCVPWVSVLRTAVETTIRTMPSDSRLVTRLRNALDGKGETR